VLVELLKLGISERVARARHRRTGGPEGAGSREPYWRVAASITLWTGRDRLQVGLGDTSLSTGAAAHMLQVQVTADALWLNDQDPPGVGIALLEGFVWLDQGHRPVGAFLPRTVVLRGFPVCEPLVLMLTDEQLIALEVLRGAGDLLLRVDLTATVLAGHAGHVAPSTGQVAYRLPAAVWHGLLDAAGAQVGVTVRVPSPLTAAVAREGDPEGEGGESIARLALRFRQAREYLREGRYEECVATCRKVLEALAREDGDLHTNDGGPDRSRDRGLARRWAEVRKAAFELASAAHHDDDVTAAMTWTRTDAEPLLAITAALLTQSHR